MARPLALPAVFAAVALSALAGAGGAATQQTPKRGGTVVVATPAPEPACLNPFDTRCVPGNSQITATRIYNRVLEAPFVVGSDFTWQPRLVTHVDQTTKPPYALTYHIRPEARWSDGTPITASDFVFTHRSRRTYGPEHDLNRTEVRSVRALDRRTVRVVLRTRLAGWRALFGPILPWHALRREPLLTVWRDGIVDPRSGESIASGPFLVQRWNRGERITLRRNARYWGARSAYIDRLVLRFGITNDMLVDAFRNGELDIAAGFPSTVFPPLEREPTVRTLTFAQLGFDHFAFRLGPGGHRALRNKLVRRAVAYGLDRRALRRAAFGEVDPDGPSRDSFAYPTWSRYYRPNWGGYRARPAEARRLLELAGCRRGADSIYRCEGERLELRFTAPFIPGGFRPKVVALAQSQLARIGIEVHPIYAPPAAVFSEILPRGEFDVALFGWTPVAPEPALKSIFGCGGDQNWMGYCQRLVTADLDQAERIFDSAQQARVLNRADVQMAKDVPAIPLYEAPQWAAVTPGVRTFAPNGFDPFVNAENWWLDR